MLLLYSRLALVRLQLNIVTHRFSRDDDGTWRKLLLTAVGVLRGSGLIQLAIIILISLINLHYPIQSLSMGSLPADYVRWSENSLSTSRIQLNQTLQPKHLGLEIKLGRETATI